MRKANGREAERLSIVVPRLYPSPKKIENRVADRIPSRHQHPLARRRSARIGDLSPVVSQNLILGSPDGEAVAEVAETFVHPGTLCEFRYPKF